MNVASENGMRFLGRIMFPILDEFGHHVAFGGRAMGDAIPKYLNSPESVVFQKRRTLYGLYAAKQAMRRAGRVIVVEGYLDAIRLSLAGVEEVVAPLGTALTDEQAELLVRFVKEVFLLYDSDEAGQKATFRSGLELLRHKAAVRVVYACVLLETLDDMEAARALYEDLGFEDIPPYYHNPLPGAHYLKADLARY